MPLVPYKGVSPRVAPSCFLAPDCWITGDVDVADNVSIFFGAVIRGDILPISVGRESNLQEQAMLHTSRGLYPCVVGDRVTVGRHAVIHGCTVRGHSIIGMGAVLLDGADVGLHCIIGAQTLVPLNMKIPERSLVVGVPAKVVRTLTDDEVAGIESSADSYIKVGAEYRTQFAKIT